MSIRTEKTKHWIGCDTSQLVARKEVNCVFGIAVALRRPQIVHGIQADELRFHPNISLCKKRSGVVSAYRNVAVVSNESIVAVAFRGGCVAVPLNAFNPTVAVHLRQQKK